MLQQIPSILSTVLKPALFLLYLESKKSLMSGYLEGCATGLVSQYIYIYIYIHAYIYIYILCKITQSVWYKLEFDPFQVWTITFIDHCEGN